MGIFVHPISRLSGYCTDTFGNRLGGSFVDTHAWLWQCIGIISVYFADVNHAPEARVGPAVVVNMASLRVYLVSVYLKIKNLPPVHCVGGRFELVAQRGALARFASLFCNHGGCSRINVNPFIACFNRCSLF